MRTIIAGSRTITERYIVEHAIRHCPWKITEMLHGAAVGVDSTADEVGKRLGYKVTPYPVGNADWKRHGRAAGPIRNQRMADNADACIIIWTGDRKTSPGSANMLDTAKRMNLTIREIVYGGSNDSR